MESENIEQALTCAAGNLRDTMLNLVSAWRLDGLSDAQLLHWLSRIAEVRAAIREKLEPR